jgi:hypothetical protein
MPEKNLFASQAWGLWLGRPVSQLPDYKNREYERRKQQKGIEPGRVSVEYSFYSANDSFEYFLGQRYFHGSVPFTNALYFIAWRVYPSMEFEYQTRCSRVDCQTGQVFVTVK